jgi:hypothetical protein
MDERRPGVIRRAIALAARHRAITATVGLIGLGLTIFVLAYFQPQKLFLDQRVNEAMPSATADAAPTITTVSTGTFRGLSHGAEGQAKVLDLGGRRVLRFENFSVQNGPDLFVYLSALPGDAPERDYPGTFLDLGRLKGNIGDQNYEIPADVDLARYRSVVIWCKRFSTPFAAASVEA